VRVVTGARRLPGYRVRLTFRLLLIAAAAGYAVLMRLSRRVPLSPDLTFLALTGWLIFASELLTLCAWHWTFLRRQYPGIAARMTGRGTRRRVLREFNRASFRGLRGRRDLLPAAGLFLLLAGLAVGYAATGNVSDACQSPTTCYKLDHYAVRDDGYYRQYPYDARGNDDPGAPWQRISRPEYIAEVGTLLRSAAEFGVWSLALGMLANVAAEGFATHLAGAARTGDGDIARPAG
jgi:hypothetical protein